jgi:hypothetical protein
MRLSFFLGLVIYLLVFVLFFFMHDYSVRLYEAYVGFTSRGVSIGGSAELMFYLFVFVNGFVFFMPTLVSKFVLLVFMVALVLFYFLPEHPIRGMAYSTWTFSMSVLALVIRSWIESHSFQPRSR